MLFVKIVKKDNLKKYGLGGIKIRSVRIWINKKMIKLINLEVLLMDNNEIMFCGRSLGFLNKKEIEKYTEEKKENKNAENERSG